MITSDKLFHTSDNRGGSVVSVSDNGEWNKNALVCSQKVPELRRRDGTFSRATAQNFGGGEKCAQD